MKMFAKVLSGTLMGIDALPVQVEVNIQQGLQNMTIVGLPDTAVKESKERVKSALENSNLPFPDASVVVNLAPADLKKEGSHLDFAIAIALLFAQKTLPEPPEPAFWVGELSLEGSLRPIPGTIAYADLARKEGVKSLFLPEPNAREGAIFPELSVYGVPSLRAMVAHILGKATLKSTPYTPYQPLQHTIPKDFSDVKGQEHAKRALEIAAAGNHNILMVGPPGTGKSLLAERIPSILPPLTLEEALETTRIHSASGLLPHSSGLMSQRPFRAPHHTISYAGMIGGGNQVKPGEITLAHNGVLFLDELTEFRRDVLEALRQPLEGGWVTITRAARTITYPSRFMLVGAMNPCRCGYYGHPQKPCRCTPLQIQQYRSRLSGPLLDRLDLQLEVPAIPYDELIRPQAGESSKAIQERVMGARERQAHRFHGTPYRTNGDMGPKEVEHFCSITPESNNLLRRATQRFGFSGRGVHRILKIARTIADLEGSERIQPPHIAEALQYRLEILQIP